MLLSIAGVPKDTICADFGLSSEYLNEPELTREELKKPGAYQKGSEPETMKLTLAFLDRSYGGAISYLEAQGVSSAEIELIRNKIIDDWSVHFSYDLDLKNEPICLSSGNRLGSYKNVVEGPISLYWVVVFQKHRSIKFGFGHQFAINNILNSKRWISICLL